MICYKDRTYCGFNDCIMDCDKKLTDKIIEDAKNFGLSICQFTEKPSCYINITKPTEKKNYRTVLAMGDLHCGHFVGLTPDYMDSIPAQADHLAMKYYKIRREIWAWYKRKVDEIKPDIVICNGDAIDGDGKKTGGREQIQVDRIKQCDMAVECIRATNADKIFMTYGTPFHTGDSEDYEGIIAGKLGAKIGSHEWIDVNGVVFDCKHKIGSSGIPHGRANAMMKERLWADIWAMHDEQPKSDIQLRSHVHYFKAVVDEDCLLVLIPALQGMGSIYGARQCSGRVTVGMISFKVYEDGTYEWEKHIAKLKTQKAEVVVA